MTIKTYTVIINNETRLRFEADLAQATAPLVIIDEDDAREVTPLQTTDAAHTARGAACIINSWLRSEGGAAFGEDEEIVVEEN